MSNTFTAISHSIFWELLCTVFEEKKVVMKLKSFFKYHLYYYYYYYYLFGHISKYKQHIVHANITKNNNNVTHQYIELHECNGNKLEWLLCRGVGDGLDRDGMKNGDRDRVGIGERGMGIGTRTNKGNTYSKLARIDKSVLKHCGSKACQSKLKIDIV